MRVVIGFESMYGSTRQVAEAVAEGFDNNDEVTVKPIWQVTADAVEAADVLVVGVPTHAHGMPRPASRRSAIENARGPIDPTHLDPSATIEHGVREWLPSLPARLPGCAAAFDTRFKPPSWLVGHPARRVSRTLARHGARPLTKAESFFVDKHEDLLDGELDRARRWGADLRRQASKLLATAAT